MRLPWGVLHDSAATCDAVPNVSDQRSADGALKNFVAEAAVNEAGYRNDECVEGDLLLGQNVFAKARRRIRAPCSGAWCVLRDGSAEAIEGNSPNSSGRGHASHEIH